VYSLLDRWIPLTEEWKREENERRKRRGKEHRSEGKKSIVYNI
jgi:hypothetical protein